MKRINFGLAWQFRKHGREIIVSQGSLNDFAFNSDRKNRKYFESKNALFHLKWIILIPKAFYFLTVDEIHFKAKSHFKWETRNLSTSRVFSSSFLLMNNLLELIRSHKMSSLSGPTFSTEKRKCHELLIYLPRGKKENKENQNPKQSGGHVSSFHGLSCR